MIERNVNQDSAVPDNEATAVKTEIEAAANRDVELHLEGEDDCGLHFRDHRLHINGSQTLLSDIKW